jgi:tetratricopeptide (TPR) repeat protein
VSAEEHSDPNLTSGPTEGSLGSTQAATPGETAGKVIGRYRLLQKIGEGGMGEVWLAEQKEPVRRRVAIKLIKAGMDTREVVARFESERQALALMDHPAIAKVFDAGSTPQGAPYFVMEYVAGVPITTYCDNHRLSTRDRLELFMHVCEGVQHAHQKAIIHRDLKPSNILITEVDGRGAPKIIDFGVAKALGQKLSADTMFTRVGALIGTPEYMSPEQANSSGQDIDTRTDVYSLGVIFYELLAGAPPIDLRKIAFEEFLRRLREEEPPKPSTKIRTQDPATSTDVAHKRHTEAPELSNQMRGDLDSIALKALEKDRARRYGSPSDFAFDIARYLNNEPVLAVQPSVTYRAGKFARRYRGALVTACAFAVVLIAAAVISIRQSIRANKEAAVAQAVNEFLQNDMLAQASAANQSGPSAKPDPHLEVRTVLDRAAVRITGKFDRQPDVEAAIRVTIGQTYGDLGLYTEARHQFERALELRRRVLGANHPETLETVSALGTAVLKQGKFPEAETLLRQNLAIQRRTLGSTHPNTLATMNNLGVVYTNEAKYQEAEAIHSEVLETRRRMLGAEHPLTLSSMTALANVYEEDGKFNRAEPLYTQALEIERRVLGPEHPRVMGTMNDLANVYEDEGKYAQAEALHSGALEMRRRILGAEHPDTLSSMMNLAVAYRHEGKQAQAEALYSHTLEIERRVLGTEHRVTLMCMNNLANVYHAQGKWANAEALQLEAFEVKRRILGPEHRDTLISMGNLGNTYAAEGKYSKAETLFKRTLEIQQRVLGPEHLDTLYTLSDLALMYQRQGKYALAGTNAAELLVRSRHSLGSEHPDTVGSAADLALAYVSQGKFIEAEPLTREAVAFYRKNQPQDWQRYFAESLWGASLAGQKKYPEAEPALLQGYAGMAAREDRMDVPDWYYLDRARDWIVLLYRASGRPGKAAEWEQKHRRIATSPK